MKKNNLLISFGEVCYEKKETPLPPKTAQSQKVHKRYNIAIQKNNIKSHSDQFYLYGNTTHKIYTIQKNPKKSFQNDLSIISINIPNRKFSSSAILDQNQKQTSYNQYISPQNIDNYHFQTQNNISTSFSIMQPPNFNLAYSNAQNQNIDNNSLQSQENLPYCSQIIHPSNMISDPLQNLNSKSQFIHMENLNSCPIFIHQQNLNVCQTENNHHMKKFNIHKIPINSGN